MHQVTTVRRRYTPPERRVTTCQARPPLFFRSLRPYHFATFGGRRRRVHSHLSRSARLHAGRGDAGFHGLARYFRAQASQRGPKRQRPHAMKHEADSTPPAVRLPGPHQLSLLSVIIDSAGADVDRKISHVLSPRPMRKRQAIHSSILRSTDVSAYYRQYGPPKSGYPSCPG